MKEGMIYQLFAKACRESGCAIKPSNDLDVIYKFTELIVKECAKVCHQIDKEYEGEDVLASWCAGDILKHFGIESKTKAGIEYTSNINAAPNIARGLASLIEKKSQ